jgi:hypothetical protein
MALKLDSLTAYVEEQKLPIIRKAVIGNRSAKEFALMTGVKGATALNLLSTDVKFGDGTACGWNEAGTAELSQRIITPGVIKVQQSYCQNALLKYWTNYQVRVAAGQKNLPFEEEFVNGVVEGIKGALEKAMWQGDITSSDTNLNKFDGLCKTLKAATVAGTYTSASGDSVTKIINETYALIPNADFERGEVVMYVSSANYRKFIQELIANGNLVITNAVADVAMPESVLIPGTNVRVIPVAGLDGASLKAVASYRDNFVYGVDMADDDEKFDLWYSKDNDEYRIAASFVAGVQVAFPDLIAIAE